MAPDLTHAITVEKVAAGRCLLLLAAGTVVVVLFSLRASNIKVEEEYYL